MDGNALYVSKLVQQWTAAISTARTNTVGKQDEVREIIMRELIIVRENMETSICADFFLRNKENLLPSSIHLTYRVQIGSINIYEKDP